MHRQPVKKSGQVILETAIVFVTLAMLIIGSIRLFANLNLNMLARIDKYRQGRLSALNGIRSPAQDFLYYSAYNNILDSDRVKQTQEEKVW